MLASICNKPDQLSDVDANVTDTDDCKIDTNNCKAPTTIDEGVITESSLVWLQNFGVMAPKKIPVDDALAVKFVTESTLVEARDSDATTPTVLSFLLMQI